MATERLASYIPHPGFPLAKRGWKPNTGRMERFLKKLGITGAQYRIWSGGQPLNEFAKANPGWTQKAWEVLILENLDIILAATQIANESRSVDSPQGQKTASRAKAAPHTRPGEDDEK